MNKQNTWQNIIAIVVVVFFLMFSAAAAYADEVERKTGGQVLQYHIVH